MDLENILNAIQPFVIMFAALFAATVTATWIAVVIWCFRDIRARSRDVFAQILATLLVLIFFPFFPWPGLILYLILRPRETLTEVYERSLEEEALLQSIEERMACPGCNRRIEEEFMICPTCHTRLKKACPSCGRLLHLRWNICPYCGAVQTKARAAIEMPPQPVTLPVEPVAETQRLASGTAEPVPAPVAETEPVPEAGPEADIEAESLAQAGVAPAAADRDLDEAGAVADVEAEPEADDAIEAEVELVTYAEAIDSAEEYEATDEPPAEAQVEASAEDEDAGDAEPEAQAETLPFEFE